MVNFFLSRNANPNLKTKDGASPLHYALRWGNERIIAILLENSDKKDKSDMLGRSPMHYAALRTTNIAAIEQVLITGCNVNKQDKYHVTPLHVACKTGNFEVVEILLRHGALIRVSDEE
jgi:ankyrin repeat protein